MHNELLLSCLPQYGCLVTTEKNKKGCRIIPETQIWCFQSVLTNAVLVTLFDQSNVCKRLFESFNLLDLFVLEV